MLLLTMLFFLDCNSKENILDGPSTGEDADF